MGARPRSRFPRGPSPRGRGRSRRSGRREPRPRLPASPATGATRVVPDSVQGLGAEIERGGCDVGSPNCVVEALGQERRERLLARVASRTVATVVAEGDRLGQGDVEPARARYGGRNLRDLERVREPRPWWSAGKMKTWVFPAKRRNAGECMIRSRSRSKQVRQGSGASSVARLPALTDRVTPGARVHSSSASRASRAKTPEGPSAGDEPANEGPAKYDPPTRTGRLCAVRMAGSPSDIRSWSTPNVAIARSSPTRMPPARLRRYGEGVTAPAAGRPRSAEPPAARGVTSAQLAARAAATSAQLTESSDR